MDENEFKSNLDALLGPTIKTNGKLGQIVFLHHKSSFDILNGLTIANYIYNQYLTKTNLKKSLSTDKSSIFFSLSETGFDNLVGLLTQFTSDFVLVFNASSNVAKANVNNYPTIYA